MGGGSGVKKTVGPEKYKRSRKVDKWKKRRSGMGVK
jgi:hypothetical protein